MSGGLGRSWCRLGEFWVLVVVMSLNCTEGANWGTQREPRFDRDQTQNGSKAKTNTKTIKSGLGASLVVLDLVLALQKSQNQRKHNVSRK